jgi:hypothetical protein
MTGLLIYTNSPRRRGDITLNFFMLNASGAPSAQLACPFFTTTEPLQLLHDAGCKSVRLIVRLCAVTSPRALAAARAMPHVSIRYFTSDAFHAKFYVLGSNAMLGSANLTDSGLKANREISITLNSADDTFDELPAYFDELWDAASVLTDAALERFATWHKTHGKNSEAETIDGLEPSSPVTINVATHTKSRERTYLESFRREYYETLLPAYAEAKKVYLATGRRHPLFAELPFDYEFDRFLNWAKLTFTTDENLRSFPLLASEQRAAHLKAHVDLWLEEPIKIDTERIGRLERLKSIFTSAGTLTATDFPDLTDALLGCAAFDDQLRFTKGGKPALAKAFQKDNDVTHVRKTLAYLAFGKEEFVRRIYDCIYMAEYKLAHFGRTSVFELYGWTNADGVPPINGRTIKALRFFGFDVRI